MALADIPFYGTYKQVQAGNRQAGLQDLQAANQTMGLLSALQKEQLSRKAQALQDQFATELQWLGPNPSQDDMATLAARYVRDPKELLKIQQGSLDRQAAMDNTRAIRESAIKSQETSAAAELEQKKRGAEMIHEFRMAGARTDADKLAETVRHNKIMEGFRSMQGGSQSASKAPSGYRTTADGNLEAIPGGPADAKLTKQNETVNTGRGTVDSLVTTLSDYYDQLDKLGAIGNPAKGTASNVGAWLSKNPVGQFAGNVFGTKAQSIRDSIAQQRPLLLNAIKAATGMSAKQMDSNAELKLYLSAATDPTLSVEANRSALAKLNELYGLGMPQQKGGATGSFDKPSTKIPVGVDPKVWSVMTPEEKSLWGK